MDVKVTLAYSFVDKERLFLRPTVRGRGVNGSIEKTRSAGHASCYRCATSTFMISRGPSLVWYDNFTFLSRCVLILLGPRRAGRGRISTTSGVAPSASSQKKPISHAPKRRCSNSVGSRSVSFVLIMATLSTRKRLSVGTCPPLSQTYVHGGDKRKTMRQN